MFENKLWLCEAKERPSPTHGNVHKFSFFSTFLGVEIIFSTRRTLKPCFLCVCVLNLMDFPFPRAGAVASGRRKSPTQQWSADHIPSLSALMSNKRVLIKTARKFVFLMSSYTHLSKGIHLKKCSVHKSPSPTMAELENMGRDHQRAR
jgi:hypothetical protein